MIDSLRRFGRTLLLAVTKYVALAKFRFYFCFIVLVMRFNVDHLQAFRTEENQGRREEEILLFQFLSKYDYIVPGTTGTIDTTTTFQRPHY